MTNYDDEREALAKAFADAIFHAGLRSPDSTMAVIALKEVLAARKHPEPEITDEMVEAAWQNLTNINDIRYYDRGEVRAALEAALRVSVGEGEQ